MVLDLNQIQGIDTTWTLVHDGLKNGCQKSSIDLLHLVRHKDQVTKDLTSSLIKRSDTCVIFHLKGPEMQHGCPVCHFSQLRRQEARRHQCCVFISQLSSLHVCRKKERGPPYTAAVRPLENGPRFEVGSFLGFCNVCTSLQFLHLHVFAFAPFAFCYFLQRSELLLSFA